jgi:outer membrane protein TolC
LLRKQALRNAAQEALTLARQGLSDTEERNRAGDVAQLDVLQAQVPVASAQATLAQADSAVAVARQALNDLMGHPLDDPLTLADITAPPTTPSETQDQARDFALQRSTDVQAADATVQADEAALEATRLYREPTFSLQAIDTRSGDQTSFSREDTLQAQVSLPLSDGGLGQAQTREATAALAQSRAQAESARRTALLTVSTAYLNAQGSGAQVTSARTARDIAQITYDKTVQGYQNGLFPFVNVLNAQNALAQARIALVQALYDAASAASTLQVAENGGAAASPTGPNTTGKGAP